MTELLKMYDEKINPKPIAVSNEDVMIARRNLYEEKKKSLLDNIAFFKKVVSGEIKGNKLITKEYSERSLMRLKEEWCNFEKKEKAILPGQKVEDVFISDSLMKFYILSLSVPHCGDCTQVPTGCERCSAEYVFGLETTRTWTPREGRKMSDALIEAGMFNFNSAECQMEDEI